MAVENHPLFPEWIKALEELEHATTELLAAAKSRDEAKIRGARVIHTVAQARYDIACDELASDDFQ